MDTTPTTPQDGSPQSTGLTHKSLTATILAIAIPSLAALVAEPLFILVDTAIVGRLGTSELAGLALASTVLTTTVGLCIFLAYATTATVARHLGAGRRTTALSAGIDGLWLAATLGALLTLTLILTAPNSSPSSVPTVTSSPTPPPTYDGPHPASQECSLLWQPPECSEDSKTPPHPCGLPAPVPHSTPHCPSRSSGSSAWE